MCRQLSAADRMGCRGPRTYVGAFQFSIRVFVDRIWRDALLSVHFKLVCMCCLSAAGRGWRVRAPFAVVGLTKFYPLPWPHL